MSLTRCPSDDHRSPPRSPQALAAHYPGSVFLRLVGNSSAEAKALFKAKLKCRATPTFYFFRGGGCRYLSRVTHP